MQQQLILQKGNQLKNRKQRKMTGHQATLVIKRTNQYANRMRSIRVLVNNVVAGNLNNGESKEYIAPVGSVTIEAKIDWCKAQPLVLSLREGERKEIELGCNATPRNLWSVFYYTFFKPGKYLYLKVV
jgi:hypothetical protein